MKRRLLWLILPLLACLPILLSHCQDPALLQDSDTAYLLTAIRQRNAPFSWFVGDWPLQNHFYRPLPTLAFEIDNRLYGNDPIGYAWTNDLLCVLCVIGLFWLLAEISQSAIWAFAGAALLSLWTVDCGQILVEP